MNMAYEDLLHEVSPKASYEDDDDDYDEPEPVIHEARGVDAVRERLVYAAEQHLRTAMVLHDDDDDEEDLSHPICEPPVVVPEGRKAEGVRERLIQAARQLQATGNKSHVTSTAETQYKEYEPAPTEPADNLLNSVIPNAIHLSPAMLGPTAPLQFPMVPMPDYMSLTMSHLENIRSDYVTGTPLPEYYYCHQAKTSFRTACGHAGCEYNRRNNKFTTSSTVKLNPGAKAFQPR
eukprot:TRINITY_DN10331_c0_g1_i1.p1 TRINITY_DN10331_c0_g1~~TRINITY_DN10331_c0_g1_i1.p1  ORF type:complete len:234 (+),score=27.73 TRINITY_DN10331_c0_g1_i1:125-826(+)